MLIRGKTVSVDQYAVFILFFFLMNKCHCEIMVLEILLHLTVTGKFTYFVLFSELFMGEA